MKQRKKILRIYEEKQICKKVYFGTEKDANEYIDKLQRTSTREVKPVRSYLCPRCKCWHLTSWTELDIEYFLKQINEMIDSFNADQDREYEQDTKLFSTALNELVELKKENKRLELEIYKLKFENLKVLNNG